MSKLYNLFFDNIAVSFWGIGLEFTLNFKPYTKANAKLEKKRLSNQLHDDFCKWYLAQTLDHLHYLVRNELIITQVYDEVVDIDYEKLDEFCSQIKLGDLRNVHYSLINIWLSDTIPYEAERDPRWGVSLCTFVEDENRYVTTDFIKMPGHGKGWQHIEYFDLTDKESAKKLWFNIADQIYKNLRNPQCLFHSKAYHVEYAASWAEAMQRSDRYLAEAKQAAEQYEETQYEEDENIKYVVVNNPSNEKQGLSVAQKTAVATVAGAVAGYKFGKWISK